MRKRPKRISDLKGFEEECEALFKFLRLHWYGLDGVRPKGYKEFTKDYEDFSGQQEWSEEEREKQEKQFKGFDVSERNFVTSVALPHVAYGDLCQGWPPALQLIHACVSYGFQMGMIHGIKDGKEKAGVDLMNLALKLLQKSMK